MEFAEGATTPNLNLQRENLKLRDEVMELRVEHFALRQKMEEQVDQTKRLEQQLAEAKSEIKVV